MVVRITIIAFFSLAVLFSPKALSRCGPLPSGKAKVKLNRITSLSKTSCGVEIEVIDALKQTWFSKGSRADFWSEGSNVCNAKTGSTMTPDFLAAHFHTVDAASDFYLQ
jgi:hypothetical protein